MNKYTTQSQEQTHTNNIQYTLNSHSMLNRNNRMIITFLQFDCDQLLVGWRNRHCLFIALLLRAVLCQSRCNLSIEFSVYHRRHRRCCLCCCFSTKAQTLPLTLILLTICYLFSNRSFFVYPFFYFISSHRNKSLLLNACIRFVFYILQIIVCSKKICMFLFSNSINNRFSHWNVQC